MIIPDDENDKNYSKEEQTIRRIFRLLKVEYPDEGLEALYQQFQIICLCKEKMAGQLQFYQIVQMPDMVEKLLKAKMELEKYSYEKEAIEND